MRLGGACAFALTLAVCCAAQGSAPDPSRELQFSDIQERRLKFPIYSFTGLSVSPGGVVYSTINEDREVHMLALRDGKTRTLRLRDLPQDLSKWQLGPKVAGDREGYLYVAGHDRDLSFRERPSSELLGVLVFKPDGRYNSQLSLTPSIEVMHMIVDALGNLFVLGVEVESLYNSLSPCLMVYKYSRTGAQLTTFSSCPRMPEGRPAEQSPGQLLSRRENTARAGQVFLYDGLIHHVIFPSRIIRIFESDGRPVRELRLSSPNAFGLAQVNGRDEVSHVVVLRSGRFLVEWTHVEQTEFGSRRTVFLRVHDRDGSVLTEAGVVPVTQSLLLYAGPDENIYFLGLRRAGQQELIRARLTLR